MAWSFNYSTSKRVLIRSKTLSILLILSTLLILGFQVTLLIGLHRYAEFETPMGLFNTWTSIPWTSKQGPDSPFCYGHNGFSPKGFNVAYSGGLMGFEYSCPAFTATEVVKIGEKSFDVDCSRIVIVDHPDCPNVSQMDVTRPLESFYNKTFIDPIVGREERCVRQHFIDNVESLPVFFIAGASTTFMKEVLVPTVLLDQQNNVLKSFNRGEVYVFTVGDFLHAAGIELQQQNMPQPFELESGWELTFRHSGVVLTIEFEYSNLRSWDISSFETRCEIRVNYQTSAWGYSGRSSEMVNGGVSSPQKGWGGSASVLKNAIRLQFFERGRLGNFSGTNVMTEIFNTIVLLFSVKVFVELIAGFFFDNWKAMLYGDLDMNTIACEVAETDPPSVENGFVLYRPIMKSCFRKRGKAKWNQKEFDLHLASRRSHSQSGVNSYRVHDCNAFTPFAGSNGDQSAHFKTENSKRNVVISFPYMETEASRSVSYHIDPPSEHAKHASESQFDPGKRQEVMSILKSTQQDSSTSSSRSKPQTTNDAVLLHVDNDVDNDCIRDDNRLKVRVGDTLLIDADDDAEAEGDERQEVSTNRGHPNVFVNAGGDVHLVSSPQSPSGNFNNNDNDSNTLREQPQQNVVDFTNSNCCQADPTRRNTSNAQEDAYDWSGEDDGNVSVGSYDF